MTNRNREMNLNELDAVTGGNFLAEVAKAALGWAVGKAIESSTYTPPATVASNLVKWQKSLK